METNNEPEVLLKEFFQILSGSCEGQKSFLYLKKSKAFIGDIPGKQKNLIYTRANKFPKKAYDIVFGDFPFSSSFSKKNFPEEITLTVESLKCISPEGIGFFLFPNYANTFRRFKLHEVLEPYQFYVNAILDLPTGFYKASELKPVMVVISRIKTKSLYLAQLEGWDGNNLGQFEIITESILGQIKEENYSKENSIEVVEDGLPSDETGLSKNDLSENLWNGIFRSPEEFSGFDHWILQEKLTQVASDYQNFKKYKVSDVTEDIRVILRDDSAQTYDDHDNAIYMPKSSYKDATVDIDQIKSKHRDYYQIIANGNLVTPKYLAYYFNSNIGKLVLQIEQSKFGKVTTSRHLSKKEFENLEIAIPEVERQNQIVATLNKLELVVSNIDAMKKNISINPISSQEDREKIDKIITVTQQLTEQERVKNLIASGETQKVEFKQTLSLDADHPNKKNKDLEKAVLKTIVAFLNTKGGDLLVGIHDDRTPVGLEQEFANLHKGKEDKFMLYFNDIFKSSIGEDKYPLVDKDLVDIDGKKILRVRVRKSREPVYLGGTEFYARTNPATLKLEGPKLVKYVQNNFPSLQER